MSHSFLVSIFGPSNVFAAVSAVKYRYPNVDPKSVTILLHTPGWDEAKMHELSKPVNAMLAAMGFHPAKIMTQQQVEQIVGEPADVSSNETLRRFRTFIGSENFTEVIYTHNIVGYAADLAMLAYPDSERITIGDALGTVHQKEFHLALATGKKWTGPSNAPKGPIARQAVLIMPVDQTGDILKNMKLTIVPQSFFFGLLDECYRNLVELRNHTHELLSQAKGKPYLLLLENMSDGGFLSKADEIALYSEILELNAPVGSTVYIKEHPLSCNEIGRELKESLSSKYNTVLIPRTFSRYPLELWRDLVLNSEIIAFSFGSVSLEFIFKKRVISPMNERLIQKYFRKELQASYRNSLISLREEVELLRDWDGKSVLWSGTYSSGVSPEGIETENIPAHVPPIENASELNQKGIEALQRGDRSSAISHFERAVGIEPKNITFLNNLAVALLETGRVNDALKFLGMAYQANQTDRSIALNLVLVAQAIGQIDIVRSVCQQYLTIAPGDPDFQRLASGVVTTVREKERNGTPLTGSWATQEAYVSVGKNVILGPSSSVDLRFPPPAPRPLVSVGDDSQLFGAFSLLRPEAQIIVGKRTQYGFGKILAAHRVEIGDDVLMAWNITIVDSDLRSYDWQKRCEDVRRFSTEQQSSQINPEHSKDWGSIDIAPVKICNRAWIGFNVTILKGVTIGEGAIVGAGSVVTQDIPAYCLAAGNPAKVIKQLPLPADAHSSLPISNIASDISALGARC